MSMQINSKQISFGTSFSPEFKRMLSDKLNNYKEPNISDAILNNLEAIKDDGENGILDFKTSKHIEENDLSHSGYFTHIDGEIKLLQNGKHGLKISSAKYDDDDPIKYTKFKIKRYLFDECLEKLSSAAVKNAYHKTNADKKQRIKDLLA